MSDELEPKEADRIRRRDRDADAEQRALRRPSMGKVFKQILDRQAKAAKEELASKRRGTSPVDADQPIRRISATMGS